MPLAMNSNDGKSNQHIQDNMLQDLELSMDEELFDGKNKHKSGQYSYYRLLNKSIIRLLILKPGCGDDELRGSLRFVSLKHIVPYEALSYCWGTQKTMRMLHLDGQPLDIPESAHTALLRLRHPREEKILWVDSICINQADNDEKSIQVTVMDKIYSSARRVVCWLGHDDDGDGVAAFDLMDRIAKADFSLFEHRHATVAFYRDNNLPPIDSPQWHVIDRFFSRPWFQRVWVVQEFILAAKAVLVCGSSEIDWQRLIPGVHCLQEYPARTRPGSLSDVSGGVTDGDRGRFAFWRMMTTKMQMDPMRWGDEIRSLCLIADVETIKHRTSLLMPYMNGLFGSPAQRLSSKLGLSLDELPVHDPRYDDRTDAPMILWGKACRYATGATDERDRGMTPCEAAILFRDCMTTNLRDRYYAFLGISAEFDDIALKPDYSESVESTFLRFARHFMLKPRASTGVKQATSLANAGIATDRMNLSLPTWVPLPTAAWDGIQDKIAWTGYQYKAAMKYERACLASNDERSIYVAGGLVGAVAQVVLQPHYPLKSFAEASKFFDFLDRTSLQQEVTDQSFAFEETNDEMIWGMLIGRNGERGRYPDELLRSGYEKERQMVEYYSQNPARLNAETGSDNMHITTPWGALWQSLTRKYSVCRTANGTLGLVPIQTESGDIISLILGEPTPIVLRQKQVDPAVYEVVGSCYLYGNMNGEAMKSRDWRVEMIRLV